MAKKQSELEVEITPATYAALRARCEFLGYGNPSAEVWFLGIEEGVAGDAYDPEKVLFGNHDHHGRLVKGSTFSYSYFSLAQHWQENPGPKLTPQVWMFTSKVLSAIYAPAADSSSYLRLEPEFKEIGAREGKAFVSDVFPLGKKKQTHWPFGKWFSRKQYEIFVDEFRFKLLRNSKPEGAVVIGHGISVWHHLENIFSDKPETAIEILNRNPKLIDRMPEHMVIAKVYPDDKLILCRFFSNRFMNDKIVKLVADQARAMLNLSDGA